MHKSISKTYVSSELYVFCSIYDPYLEQIKNKSFEKKVLFATATFSVIFAITKICLTTNIVYIFLVENFFVRHITTTLKQLMPLIK